MRPIAEQHIRTWLRSIVCFLLAWASVGTNAVAQTLPPFERFPADAPGRLARAVDERVQSFASDLGGDEIADIVAGRTDRSDLRQRLWQSIEGTLGSSQGAAVPSGARVPSAPATLIGLLDSAIAAYMTELGQIALELDQHGDRDAVSRLAPLHPGEQGSGTIDVGTVGAFRRLEIHFRGEIAHPDGRTPAVVAHFYLLPTAKGPPIPGRLLIPTAGAEPSFRAEIATATGARETRDYGWRPRLTRLGAILELNLDGQWARVEDETEVVPRRRFVRDPLGFCDATCVDR